MENSSDASAVMLVIPNASHPAATVPDESGAVAAVSAVSGDWQ